MNRTAVYATTISPGSTSSTSFINEDLFPPGLDYCMKTAYVVVALLGLLGNGVIFYLFGSKRVKFTSFNVLLLNLSISDAMADLSIWAYVFVDLKTLRGFRQKNADSLCLVTMGQLLYWVATIASVFTLSVISVSRYFFIRHPMSAHHFNKKHASLIVILTIWPAAIAMTLPNFFSWHYDYTYAVCRRNWPQGVNGQYYSLITAVLGYVLPTIVLVYTFVATRQQLWVFNKRSTIQNPSAVKRRKKASMLLGALVLTFFVCWGPFFVYWILSRTATSIFPKGPEGEYVRMRAIVFVVLISLCNSVADPIIYGLRGEDFRKTLIQMRHHMPCFASNRRERALTKSSDCPEMALTRNSDSPKRRMALIKNCDSPKRRVALIKNCDSPERGLALTKL